MGNVIGQPVQKQAIDPNISIVFENMVAEWGVVPFAELSVLLVHLRFLTMVHQTHHWITKGDAFFGDHLLFERLYNETVAEVDALAEKSIGLGGTDNVNIVLQTSQVMRLVSGYGSSTTLPHPSDLARRSLAAECNFLKTAAIACERMKENSSLSRGLDNLLASIQDTHEGHIYLLKQRTKG